MSLTIDSPEKNKISDYWRLCDELTLKQAALLIVECDPSSEAGYCEKWEVHLRPTGYEASKQALSSALRKAIIMGQHFGKTMHDINGNEMGEYPETTDVDRSTLERDSLIKWLSSRGIKTGFFFPDDTTYPDYMDPKNGRYSSKLAAAVKVWQAMEDVNLRKGKAPTVAMHTWLETRYKDLGLEWAGKINNTGITEVVKVANWQTSGGATKTPE
jgi:hypothetical protein